MNPVVAIERQATALDDPALAAHDTVFQFWADGDVTATKGGELFGARSLFSLGIPVTNRPVLRLPHPGPGGGQSYAILTQEQALAARQALKDFIYPGLPDVPSHFHPIAPSLQDVYEGRAAYKLQGQSGGE